jgi:hypothetical protein
MAMKDMQEKKIMFKLMIFCWLIIGFYPLSLAHALELNIPESHAVSLIEKPRCTECHTDETGVAMKPVATFTHSSDWIKTHRFYSSQTSTLCSACHSFSFCTDCHAYKGKGLKPSERYSGSTDRWLPHRGNYLFQHRIDGKIDPTGCFRCHGRQNNRMCKRCHR